MLGVSKSMVMMIVIIGVIVIFVILMAAVAAIGPKLILTPCVLCTKAVAEGQYGAVLGFIFSVLRVFGICDMFCGG